MNFTEIIAFPLILFTWICTLFYIVTTLIIKRIQENKRDNEGEGQIIGLDKLPGPPKFPVIGNAFQLPAPKYIMETLFDWCQKYGPCFRITVFGIECVVISKPSMAQSLLASYNMGHVNRASTYKLLEGFDGLAFSNGNKWQRLKKIIAPVFHFKSFEQQVTMFNRHSDKLVNELRYIFGTEKDRNKTISKLLGSYALQSIVDSVVSLPGCYNDADVNYFLTSFKRYTEITSHRILHPWLALRFIWRFHPLSVELDEAVKGMNKFSQTIIQNHIHKINEEINGMAQLGNDVENRCLISQMLKLNYSCEEMQSEVTTMLFAHESNTLSLLYFLLLLALNPEHQERCRAEVDQLYNEAQDRSDKVITYDDMPRLKHLERCLLESLRLLPPVFLFGRKLESPLRLENNVTLPIGTNVYVSPLVMHKDPNYFPNPDVFNPDRFMPEECKKRHQYAYLPFSAGPRICMGMKSAILSIKILVAKILHSFEILSEEKMKNLEFQFTLTMSPEREPGFVFVSRKMH